jgi:flagellar biosynthesis chaperone FliJ
MKPIELLLRLAKIREDQAMANARRATGQVNQAQGFQKQVLDYAKDYENQIMEGAKTGTTVAFIQDANAFREKLLLSSAEITNQIKGLSMNSEQALKIAMQAKMRSQGLGKFT